MLKIFILIILKLLHIMLTQSILYYESKVIINNFVIEIKGLFIYSFFHYYSLELQNGQ